MRCHMLIPLRVFTLIGIHFAQCVDFFGVNAMHKYDTYIWFPSRPACTIRDKLQNVLWVFVCVLINLKSITWQQSEAATGHAAYKYESRHTDTERYKRLHLYKYFLCIHWQPGLTNLPPSVVVCVCVGFFLFSFAGPDTPTTRSPTPTAGTTTTTKAKAKATTTATKPEPTSVCHFVLISQIHLFRSVRWWVE